MMGGLAVAARRWLVAAVLVASCRAIGLGPRHGADVTFFTDWVPIDVWLEADERVALIYVDGALVTELPDKAWAVTSEPPCAAKTPARAASTNLRVPRGAAEIVAVAVACDGSYRVSAPAVVRTAADARDVPGCEDVRARDVRVVDAFVSPSASRSSDEKFS